MPQLYPEYSLLSILQVAEVMTFQATLKRVGLCSESTEAQKAEQNKFRGLQSTSELYRPSGRNFSTNLVPIFAARGGVAWSVQRVPTALNRGSLDRSRYFFIQIAPHLSPLC
jgi:hypothetical protein